MRSSAFLLVLLSLCGTSAHAAESYVVTGLPRGAVLQIRETPDTDARVVGAIPAGRLVRGFGCAHRTPSGAMWCRVKYGAAVGWASQRYLEPPAPTRAR